jgi:acetylornithine deacetylase/succinyl-diaminopimelate desuccinylase-like protein
MSVDKTLERYAQDREAHLKDLEDLVRIPSVSFDGFDPQEVQRSARAVAELLKKRGLENVEILTLPGAHPYVYGDWLQATGKPTLLLYAHHDVQPPGREEVWKSPPFEPTRRDGRVFGRGVADDKGGIVVHTAAIASYLASAKSLPVNVKVIIEGEEECGSLHLPQFLETYKKKLQADAMVLTDASNFDTGLPALTVSLRGLVIVDVEVRALDHPLHSGMWGGPLPDPAIALSKMLASLQDDQGRIAIQGIYDKVRPVTDRERAELRRLPVTNDEFRRQTGLVAGAGFVGGVELPYEAIWRQPSLSVNAIQASSKRMAANIICDVAWARVGIRIVPDQVPGEVKQALLEHLRARVPWGLEVTFSNAVADTWWMTDPTGPAFEKARKALTLGYGKEPVIMGCGGSIPFVGPFAHALGGVPALLVGVEDPYTNAHSENESMDLRDFDSSVRSEIHLFDLMGR